MMLIASHRTLSRKDRIPVVWTLLLSVSEDMGYIAAINGI
jgi:hypothetical protein